jgi:ATP-dependent exoDNAse (exonuclease V) beta subunit
MSGLLVDQAARNRIANDLDRNLGVEAAAGTGKTTVLVRRVVNLLASGRVSVDQLVVITFTEKAAAELATRVRDALEERAASAEGEERTRILQSARDLYRAHIETIHSFAAALLRERPVEAPIDPLFQVLDELAAGLEFNRAYERFQDELFSEQRPELELALRRGLGLTELREACECLNEHRYLLPLQHPERPEGELEQLLAELRLIASELQGMLTRHQPGEDKAVPIVEGILDWIEKLEALDPSEQERRLLFRPHAKTHLGVGSDNNWGGEKARLKELQERYCHTVEQAQVTMRCNALLAVLPYVERFVEEYTRARRRAGQADFDDLLFWARDLLRDSAAARHYFRKRFRAVLIDEFQDTDPIQAELALLLTSDEEPREDWRELRPAPGRLTGVGDPKQSIYRFRRADIAVYDQVKGRALADRQERISTNFRSNPQLLAALNAAFDRILVAEPHMQPGNVPLDPPPSAAVAQRAPIVLAEGHFAGSADEVRAEEARVIAGMLHTARRDGWQIRDRQDEDRWRKCRWGDMTILLPARTDLELYEEALAAAGIPYRHEGARDFFRREEVRDLIWVLSAIDDPTDRVALIGALRSSAFAVSDEQFVIHAAANRALSYRSPDGGPSEPVNEALAELNDLHRMRRGLSLAEVVRRVVERTRLVEFALTRRAGEQGAANLLAIVDEARLFAAAGGGGLRPFIRHLRESMEEEAIEIEATVAEETDDVVRIMTMHGAKGLEYPIVALANLGTQWTPKKTAVPREHESFLHFHVGAKSVGRTGHFATPGYEKVWEGESEHVEAERLRMLYVAATRARDHLLIPCVVGSEAAGHLLGDLVHALPENDALISLLDADSLVVPALETREAPPVGRKQIEAAVKERAEWAAGRETLMKQASRERDIETASSRERGQGPLAAEVATFASALVLGEGPPIPVGDAVHMVMERTTLPAAEDLEAIAEDVCLEGDIADQLEDVIVMCRACLQADSVQRALASQRYWREVPFLLSRTEDSRNADTGPLATGRVDLVYQDDEELVVVDYKTDKDVTADMAEDHALEKHSGQAEIYSQALAASTGLPVREVVFVYCKAGVEVRLQSTDAPRANLREHDRPVSIIRHIGGGPQSLR